MFLKEMTPSRNGAVDKQHDLGVSCVFQELRTEKTNKRSFQKLKDCQRKRICEGTSSGQKLTV